MTDTPSLPPEYFERMFAADADPWAFETSAYEAEKYHTTLAALACRKYATAFEVGCANGVLTSQLATRCDALLAIDVSASALARAGMRLADDPSVTLRQMTFPAEQPDGEFDLIVMSEVVYYWDAGDIAKAAEFVDDQLTPGGDLLLVHWTGETDYPHSGDEAVALMRRHLPSLRGVLADRHAKYRLDLWRKS